MSSGYVTPLRSKLRRREGQKLQVARWSQKAQNQDFETDEDLNAPQTHSNVTSHVLM